jgi:hypothetical protein
MLVMLISTSCFGVTNNIVVESYNTNINPLHYYGYITTATNGFGDITSNGFGDITSSTNECWVDPTVTDSQIEYAKIAWRKEHPYCAVCNYLPEEDQEANHVHHIVPVHIDRTKAASCFNFVTLCQRHHWWVAHCGTGWKTYNTNVLQTIDALRIAFSNTVGRAK